MRKTILSVIAACFVLGLISQAFSNDRTDDPLGVAVSPQTLLLDSDQGGLVMVHTSIPYSEVDHGSLALDGVLVSWTKADARGHLVAAFDEMAIKTIVAPPGLC